MRFRTGITAGSILKICAWEVHVGTTSVQLMERMRRTLAPRPVGRVHQVSSVMQSAFCLYLGCSFGVKG